MVREIEGLRCLAIVAVLLFHVETYARVKAGIGQSAAALESRLSWFFQQGHIGVQMFFVLSGFVLAVPFCRSLIPEATGGPARTFNLVSYFKRRLLRLEPPYLISLVVLFAILVWRGSGTVGDLLPHLLASAFYLHNVVFGSMSTINGVAWSLEIEFQFYVLLPLLVSVLRLPLFKRRLVIVVMIAGSLILVAHLPAHHVLGRTLVGYLHYFLTGIVLADAFTLCRRNERHFGWDVAACLGLAGVLAFASSHREPLGPSALVVAIGFLLWGALRGRVASQVFSWWPACLLGGMCYSIYLVHYSLISVIGRGATLVRTGSWNGDLLLQSVLIVPGVLVGCLTFFLVVERPTMHREWLRLFRAACWRWLRWTVAVVSDGLLRSVPPTWARLPRFRERDRA